MAAPAWDAPVTGVASRTGRAILPPMPQHVVALAGRRIDPTDAAEPRFPSASAALVGGRIRAKLTELGATTLVSSAACGADLLALAAAESLGIHRVVVLPFDAPRFRSTSVTDRPGGTEVWGPLFDEMLAPLPQKDVIVLPRATDGDAAYAAVNEAILAEAARRATPEGEVTAVVVWDGRERDGTDLSAQFMQLARRRGIPVTEVPIG